MKVSKIEVDAIVDAQGNTLLDLLGGGTVWTSNNDGAGSTLDAGMVAGVDAAAVSLRSNIMSKVEFERLKIANTEKYAGSGQVSTASNVVFDSLVNDTSDGTDSLLHTMGSPAGRPLRNSLAFVESGQVGSTGDARAYFNVRGVNYRIDTVAGNLANANGDTTYPLTNGIPFAEPKLPIVERSVSSLLNSYSKGDHVYVSAGTTNLLANAIVPGAVAMWPGLFGNSSVAIAGGAVTITHTGGPVSWAGVGLNVSSVSGLRTLLNFTVSSTNISHLMLRVWARDGTNRDYAQPINGSTQIDMTDTEIDSIQFLILNTGNGPASLTLTNLYMLQNGTGRLVAVKDSAVGADINDGTYSFVGVDSFSRRDFVFMETWIEDVSSTGMVYHHGAVQSSKRTATNLPNATRGMFVGSDTYSRFGDWEGTSALPGYGHVWESLSQAEQLIFASDPDNNVFMDDGVVKQALFRIHVVSGLTNTWNNIDSAGHGGGNVNALNRDHEPRLYGRDTPRADLGPPDTNVLFGGTRTTDNLGTYGNDYRTAVPLMLVQRRNPGIFHPVYNPDGCATICEVGVSKKWYQTKLIKSVADCFNPNFVAITKLDGSAGASPLASLLSGVFTSATHTPSGTINSLVSGRPDGLFVDQITSSDVEDIRYDGTKIVDNSVYLEDEFRKYISGERRGVTRQHRLVKLGTSVFKTGPTTYNVNYNRDGIIAGGHSFPATLTAPLNGTSPQLTSAYRDRVTKTHSSSMLVRGNNGNTCMIPKVLYNTAPGNITTIAINEYDNNTAADLDRLFPPSTILTFHGIVETTVVSNGTDTTTDIIGDPRNFFSRATAVQPATGGGLISIAIGDIHISRNGDAHMANYSNAGGNLGVIVYDVPNGWTRLGLGTDGGYPDVWFTDGISGMPNLSSPNNKSSLLNNSRKAAGGWYSVKLNKPTAVANLPVHSVIVTIGNTTTELLSVPINDVSNIKGYYITGNHTISFNITGGGTHDQAVEAKAIIQVTYSAVAAESKTGNPTDKVVVLGNAVLCQHTTLSLGASVVADLLGKPSTSIFVNAGSVNHRFKTTEISTIPSGAMDTSSRQTPISHPAILVDPDPTPKVKVLPILQQTGLTASLGLIYKEIKYDTVGVSESPTPSNTVGDNDIFETDTAVGSRLDDNNNSIVYGLNTIRLRRFKY